ncbi:hypothetical protein E2562_026834 [Oryza meyeriana var. granulata]|uniref:Uncharacterized protein n=1 Tax=Oryza meyeriana var. granulata TaxID=110450 RepID=A0A6G1CJ51_9ORYZ|nr:hypothetical protein E2562_026834 [Oryza meyeriana var. granulata]
MTRRWLHGDGEIDYGHGSRKTIETAAPQGLRDGDSTRTVAVVTTLWRRNWSKIWTGIDVALHSHTKRCA